MRNRAKELIIDPDSKQYSMSRLCLGVLILGYLPILAVCEIVGYKLNIWGHIAVIVGSVCGVYGINSGARVWRKPKVQEDRHGD